MLSSSIAFSQVSLSVFTGQWGPPLRETQRRTESSGEFQPRRAHMYLEVNYSRPSCTKKAVWVLGGGDPSV